MLIIEPLEDHRLEQLRESGRTMAQSKARSPASALALGMLVAFEGAINMAS